MRFSDLLKISLKSIRGKWPVFIAFGIGISVFCLYFAGTVFLTVRQEKSEPFELIVSNESSMGITDTVLAEILETPNVMNATPVVQIPVRLNIGGYNAELTLTGIDPSYLDIQSGLPVESVMPYILLNEAACKLFSTDNEIRSTAEAPKIDWLDTKVDITMGEDGAAIISKIFGVLASEKNDEPVAYISLNSAKRLLKASGQTTTYRQAYVRIKDIGCAESVGRALGVLQLTDNNVNAELQTKWDIETIEMTYLIVIGAFSLICSAVLLVAWRRIIFHEQQEAYTMLHWLGIKQKDITKLLTMQAVLAALIGVCVGFIVALTLPSFLPQDLRGISIFML